MKIDDLYVTLEHFPWKRAIQLLKARWTKAFTMLVSDFLMVELGKWAAVGKEWVINAAFVLNLAGEASENVQ